MQRKPFAIAAAVLLLAISLPALGHAQAGPRVAALQIRVLNMGTGNVEFVPLGERIVLEPGQKYRISLVGADNLRDNTGDMGINARFREATGRGAIALGNAEGNWVIVEQINRSNGQASIDYEVVGSYNMPAAWRTGRIHFDLVRGVGAGSISDDAYYDDDDYSYNGRPVTDRERWRQSRELVRMLYRSVLQEGPRRAEDRNFQADIDQVYRDGVGGLRDVARDLADEAEDRGVFANRRPDEVVAELYHDLLGRTASAGELYRTDGGFRRYVGWVDDRNGLERVVDAIVGSEEFRRNHDLDQYGLMRSARY